MMRQITTWMLLIGLLAAGLAMLFWPGGGLIHSGPVALIGAGLLAGALMKHARATHP